MANTIANVETLTNVTLTVGTTDLGFLEDGVTVKTSVETNAIYADQSMRPLYMETTAITRTIEAMCMEYTLANLALTEPGIAAASAGTLGEAGTKYYSVTVVGTKRDGGTITLNLPNCAVISNMEKKFSVKGGAMKVAVLFQECVPTTNGTEVVA